MAQMAKAARDKPAELQCLKNAWRYYYMVSYHPRWTLKYVYIDEELKAEYNE